MRQRTATYDGGEVPVIAIVSVAAGLFTMVKGGQHMHMISQMANLYIPLSLANIINVAKFDH